MTSSGMAVSSEPLVLDPLFALCFQSLPHPGSPLIPSVPPTTVPFVTHRETLHLFTLESHLTGVTLTFRCVLFFFHPCRWMEVCLVEELPPTTELEEGLRNGVYLAKLAKFFAPKMVSEKKIYDVEQTRYKVTEI